jgi:hypothetical protein
MTGKDIDEIEKQSKDLFDALPLVDSHMMGDDKRHHARTVHMYPPPHMTHVSSSSIDT